MYPVDIHPQSLHLFKGQHKSPVFTPHSILASDLQIPCLAKVALLGLRQARDVEKVREMKRQRNSEGEEERDAAQTEKDR